MDVEQYVDVDVGQVCGRGVGVGQYVDVYMGQVRGRRREKGRGRGFSTYT